MKTHIDLNTLELFTMIACDSPPGFIVLSHEGEHSILHSLGLVTSLDQFSSTRTTDLGEVIATEFIDRLRSL